MARKSEKNDCFRLQRCLRFNLTVLKICGIWTERNDWELSFQIRRYAFLATMYYLIATVFLYFYVNINDLTKSISCLPFGLILLLTTVKTTIFMARVGTVNGLLNSLNNNLFIAKHPEQERFVATSVLKTQAYTQILFYLAQPAAVLYCFSPIFEGQNENGYYRPPLLAWLPSYFLENHTAYPYIFAFQIGAVLMLAIITPILDAFLTGLMALISGQIDMNNFAFQNVVENARQNVVNVRVTFQKCYDHHMAIKRFLITFGECFKQILFLQFFGSSILICVTIFTMEMNKSAFNSLFISLCFLIICILQEIFMFCWYGNEIETKSYSTSILVFKTDWLSTDRKFQKMLITFMALVGKPLRIRAGSLVILNMASFIHIMRTSYSYYALLQSMR